MLQHVAERSSGGRVLISWTGESVMGGRIGICQKEETRTSLSVWSSFYPSLLEGD